VFAEDADARGAAVAAVRRSSGADGLQLHVWEGDGADLPDLRFDAGRTGWPGRVYRPPRRPCGGGPLAEQWDPRIRRGPRRLSSADNRYNRDYLGEDAEGDQLSTLNAWRRDADGVVCHRYATELVLAPNEPSKNSRQVDPIGSLRGMLDPSPEGRTGDF
jgi:hypothetical protein